MQQKLALYVVVLELLTGNPGGAVQAALNGMPTLAHAQPRWLHRIITKTPLLWSQANEGYFSNQTLVDAAGVQAFATTITLPDVTAWLAGNPLAAHLTNQEREHAVLATIAALAGTSGAGVIFFGQAHHQLFHLVRGKRSHRGAVKRTLVFLPDQPTMPRQ